LWCIILPIFVASLGKKMHVVISRGTSGKYESKNQQHIPELTATNMCHHVPVRREVCSLLVAAAACHIGEKEK
jgi:hypothetical protein